jgi:hypothetical protein
MGYTLSPSLYQGQEKSFKLFVGWDQPELIVRLLFDSWFCIYCPTNDLRFLKADDGRVAQPFGYRPQRSVVVAPMTVFKRRRGQGWRTRTC